MTPPDLSPMVSPSRSVTLQQGWVAECEHMEGVWLIPSVEIFEGTPFFRVNPHSSALSRFITVASRGGAGAQVALVR